MQRTMPGLTRQSQSIPFPFPYAPTFSGRSFNGWLPVQRGGQVSGNRIYAPDSINTRPIRADQITTNNIRAEQITGGYCPCSDSGPTRGAKLARRKPVTAFLCRAAYVGKVLIPTICAVIGALWILAWTMKEFTQ